VYWHFSSISTYTVLHVDFWIPSYSIVYPYGRTWDIVIWDLRKPVIICALHIVFIWLTFWQVISKSFKESKIVWIGWKKSLWPLSLKCDLCGELFIITNHSSNQEEMELTLFAEDGRLDNAMSTLVEGCAE